MFADDSLTAEASDFLKPKDDGQSDDALDLGDKKRAQEAQEKAVAARAKGNISSLVRSSHDGR